MKNKFYSSASALTLALLLAMPQLAYSQELKSRPHLEPRVELNAKIGSERNIGVVQGWIPLAQDPGNGKLIYSDIRLMRDNKDNGEGNLGIGYREMVPSANVIAGGYTYIDRRETSLDNTFYQLTVGGELIQEDRDIRLNAYIPLSGKKTKSLGNDTETDPYLAGTGIFYDENRQVITETPLAGFDLEYGHKIPVFEDTFDSVRAYAAVYGFYGDDARNVQGARARFQIDINPEISVGGRIQHDEVRGTQSFAELTFRFPATKQSFRKHGLYARMDEAPERDVDIVSGSVKSDEGRKAIPVQNAANGQAQKIYYVDNTNLSAGNGSIDNPFRNLSDAQASAGAHDIIYVSRGDGTSTGQNAGIVLAHEGMRLVGSGVDFTFDDAFSAGGNNFNGKILKAAAGEAIITNSAGDGVSVTDNNIEIAGISVTGATGNGISVNGDNVTIHDVKTLSSGSHGISATNSNNFTIKEIVSDANAGNGIFASADGGTMNGLRILDSSFDNNVNGVQIHALNGGTFADTEISGNEVTDFAVRGIDLLANGSGTQFDDTRILRNSVSLAPGVAVGTNQALSVIGENSALYNDLLIANNENSYSSVGIYVNAATGADFTGITEISSNNTHHNTLNGIFVLAINAGSTVASLDIKDNISNLNANGGVGVISATSASIANYISSGNDTNNNLFGQYVTAQGGIVTSAQFLGNTARNNTTGLLYNILSAGQSGSVTFRQNTLQSNGAGSATTGALSITVANASSTMGNVIVENNIITLNNGHGVYVAEGTGGNYTGVIDFGGGGLSAGGNSIHGNRITNTTTYKDFRVQGGSAVVVANQNWWGQSGGPIAGQTQVSGAGTSLSTASPLSANPH